MAKTVTINEVRRLLPPLVHVDADVVVDTSAADTIDASELGLAEILQVDVVNDGDDTVVVGIDYAGTSIQTYDVADASDVLTAATGGFAVDTWKIRAIGIPAA